MGGGRWEGARVKLGIAPGGELEAEELATGRHWRNRIAPVLPQQGLPEGRKWSARQISLGLGLWERRERWVTLVPALTRGDAVALEPELACAFSEQMVVTAA